MRITVACPEALREDANNLAMVLAFGPADELTYGELNWVDQNGNLYAAASFEARPEWVGAATSELVRPAWDTENYIDMTAARRAQAAMVFWSGEGEPPKADPNKLTAIGGVEGMEALSMMGITQGEN